MIRETIQKTSAFFSNGLIYGLNGIYLVMPLFLSEYFNSIEAGYLLSIQPLLMCIAPLFWGNMTDRAKNQNMVMVVLLTGSALAMLALKINTSFIFVAIMLTIYSFFQTSFGSLIDVLTIKSSERFDMNYGVFRIMGSIGYGAMAYFITLQTNTENFVYVYALISLLSIISVLFMVGVYRVGDIPREKNKDSNFRLSENGELWLLIIILGATFFTWGYYANFFPTYITETLGLSKSVWGIVAFLTAFSELPFFIYYNKIFRKIRIKNIVIISSLAIMVRWIVFATVTNTAVLIGVSFITGMFITVLTYCSTYYIITVIAPNYVNRAQSLMYAVGTGIPKVLAGCIGGYMTEFLGETKSFALCAIISVAIILLTLICSQTMDSIDEKISKCRKKPLYD